MASDQLMLFVEDFLAPIFPSQGKVLASPDLKAAYGQSTPDLLATFDLNTSSWRTSQLCLIEGLTRFSETWPRSGMTRNGTVYQLPLLVPRTSETEFGLLPIPIASNTKAIALRTGGRPPKDYTQIWRTPTASDATKWNNQSQADRLAKGQSLRLCTQVSPEGGKGGSLNPTWVEWLMGFPAEWTVLEDSATPSSRRSRKSSGGRS